MDQHLQKKWIELLVWFIYNLFEIMRTNVRVNCTQIVVQIVAASVLIKLLLLTAAAAAAAAY